MKKSPRKPTRAPVLAIRISPTLHDRIRAFAEASGTNMSDTAALLLADGFRCHDYDDAFGEAAEIIRRAKEEARLHREGFAFSKSGFPPQGKSDASGVTVLDPGKWPASTEADRARIKAVMDEFERRIFEAMQPSQTKEKA